MTEPQKYTSDSKCRAWSVAICKGPLLISENQKEKPKTQSEHLARVPATSTPALLLQVDDTKEDKHSDVQLDLLSISRLFFSRFSILNVGSVLSKSLLV